MKQTRLIVNADDFGMSRGITDGIIQAHHYGSVTSASLMANMPAAEYAVAGLKDLPMLSVGVHLNICQGRPVLPSHEIPSLVDDKGNFCSPPALIPKLWRFGVSGREIEAEFRAQIRWLKERGIDLTHADSHHHMHIYPAAVGPFTRALAAERICCARAPRCTAWPQNFQRGFAFRKSMGGPHKGGITRRLLVRTYRNALQFTAFRKLHMPASRISLSSGARHGSAILSQQWKAAITHVPPGTFELACHPGLFERGFSETDAIGAQREEELRWLTGKEWLDVVRRAGVCLISYRELIERGAAQPSTEMMAVVPRC